MEDKQETGRTEMVSLFGDVGTFVLLARELRNGASIEKAAAKAEISRNTATKVIRNIETQRGTKLVAVVKGRRPDSGAAPPTLTEEGKRLLSVYEEMIAKGGPLPKHQEKSIKIRVAIEADPFLEELVGPAIDAPNYQRLSRDQIRKGLFNNSKGEGIDCAVVWAQPGEHWWPASVESAVRLGQAFKLVVVSRDSDAIREISKKGTVVVPKWLNEANQTHYAEGTPTLRELLGKFCVAKPSFGDVLSTTTVGVARFGVVPALYNIIDPYRCIDRLAYADLPPDDRYINSVQVVVLIKDENRSQQDTENLIGAIRERLAKQPQTSEFDRDAPYRTLPTECREYKAEFYSYYVETLNTETPEWRKEVLRFTDVARGNAKANGSHTVLIQAGELFNSVYGVFNLTGGVQSDHLLYLVANGTRSKNATSLANGGFRLLRDLLAAEPNVEPAKSSPPISFIAFFPYYRIYKGKKVWQGFWLGHDALRHPLANAMIVSDHALSASELRELSKNANLRLIAHTAKGFDRG